MNANIVLLSLYQVKFTGQIGRDVWTKPAALDVVTESKKTAKNVTKVTKRIGDVAMLNASS